MLSVSIGPKISYFGMDEIIIIISNRILLDPCSCPSDEFFWISEKKIMPEKMPPVTFEVGSWYLFTTGLEPMVGKCHLLDGRHYIWVINGIGWYVDEIKILAGPFTLEELVNMKPL